MVAMIVRAFFTLVMLAGLGWLGWFVLPYYVLLSSALITSIVVILFVLAALDLAALIWLV